MFHLVFANDGTIIGVGRVVDNGCSKHSEREVQGEQLSRDVPPFGPVEDIVVKDNPRNKLSSLYKYPNYELTGGAKCMLHLRAEFLKLISSLAFRQLHASFQLFF